MSELFDMGKYGFYVWSSYALFAAMLVWDIVLPRLRERRVLRAVAQRAQRERARKDTKSENAA
jgi:heme exporter protein D